MTDMLETTLVPLDGVGPIAQLIVTAYQDGTIRLEKIGDQTKLMEYLKKALSKSDD